MAAVAQLLSLIVGVVAVPMATILLMVADTWEGRRCAAAVLFATAAILLMSFGRSATSRRRGYPEGVTLDPLSFPLRDAMRTATRALMHHCKVIINIANEQSSKGWGNSRRCSIFAIHSEPSLAARVGR